jgi:hypothetical protein
MDNLVILFILLVIAYYLFFFACFFSDLIKRKIEFWLGLFPFGYFFYRVYRRYTDDLY